MRIKRIHPIIIKYGGSLIRNPSARKLFFKNIVILSRVHKVILVHGGGSVITAYLKALKIKTRFVKGLRYTDARSMEVVEMALSGLVNKDIVSRLNAAGARAAGVSVRDGNMIIARPVPGLGKVGTPAVVDARLLDCLLSAGFLPVVSPVGNDVHGKAININADETACALAIRMKARRLVFVTDVPGILDVHGKPIPKIVARHSEDLIKKGIVTGGMIPKLQSAANAVKKGVHEVDIIQGGKTLSFTRGTRII